MSNLFLVDDHPAIREGLASFLKREGFTIAGSVSTIEKALAITAPVDLFVLDYDLRVPIKAKQVGLLQQKAPCVVYSAVAHERGPKVLGADALVDKNQPLPRLVQTLRGMLSGERPNLNWSNLCTEPMGLAALSEREREVFDRLCLCETPKEIAAQLDIARSTTYCHIDKIRHKLGAETLQEMVAIGLLARQ